MKTKSIFRKISEYLCIGLGVVLILVGCGGGGGGGGGGSIAPTTYTISGTVTLGAAAASGVSISLTGASTANTTTASDGTYSFTGLANGSYNVTPSHTGFTFTPTAMAVTLSGANMTANFTETVAVATYSISGTVSGAVSNGVTLNLTGANTGSVTAGAGGTYTFTGLVPGSYTVTPVLSGYTFNPTSTPVTITAANVTGTNFVSTAIPVPYSISGTVSGAVTAGVTITVTGTATAATTTIAGGTYTVPNLFNGSYTVTPSLTGYTFNPNSTAVTINGANVTGTNFVSTANVAPTYTLSGTVTGPYFTGVTITLSGAASATTTTTSSGTYSFSGLLAGSYTVTPSLAGYTYAPSAPSVTISTNTTQNFTASSAIASSTISGTITYAGAKTGITHIQVFGSGCTSGNNCTQYAGTSIANANGPFTAVPYTIKGLPPTGTGSAPSSYVVTAYIDTLGFGNTNTSNPVGSSSSFTTVAGTNNTGVNITIANQTPAVPAAPTNLSAAPTSGAALIQYNPPTDSNNNENATSYTLTWGTDPVTAVNSGLSKTFKAQGTNSNVYILPGLTNGQQLYFKLTATNGSGSASTVTTTPVTIGATTGAGSVSGTVTFPGTATGPMGVGAYNNSTGNVYFTIIQNPTSPQSYTVAGIPSGTYNNFAVIDMNNDGLIDAGDLYDTNGNSAPSITVTSGSTTTGNLTLNNAGATATVQTDHQFDGTNNNYGLELGINYGTKIPVAATLVSGRNMPVPFDIGVSANNNTLYTSLGSTSPTVGDTYTFLVTYSDGTTGTITNSVSEVLSTFATNLTVTTTAPYSPTVPLFSWTDPAPATSYTYSLSVNGNGNSVNWNYPQHGDLTSTTTSVVYDTDGSASSATLPAGTYTWQVQVRDTLGNSATRQTTYTH